MYVYGDMNIKTQLSVRKTKFTDEKERYQSGESEKYNLSEVKDLIESIGMNASFYI
jgi:hypothetical protein